MNQINFNHHENNKTDKHEDEIDQTDDGILENEAEIILDYIEKFNDLFENKNYIESAYFAAASPRNILRNLETLYRFKGNIISNLIINSKHLIFFYCFLSRK